MPEQPFVTVTPLQLFEKLTQIDTKLEVSLAGQTTLVQHVDDHESRLRVIEEVGAGKRINDHAARLRALEAWRYALPSSFVMAGGALVAELARAAHVFG